jgi:F0F1-type ATP synthase assembly protein I
MAGFPELSQIFNAGPWFLVVLSLVALCTGGARQ